MSFLKTKTGIAVAVLVVIAGGYWLTHRGGTTYQFITVQRGTIAEEVSVTGNTTPTQSVSLGFQDSGTIASVFRALGDSVRAGDVVAELNLADLSAAVQQAKANVAIQQAKLDGLKAGAQPEDIAASQAALQKAQQDLANYYSSISDSSVSGYAKANDAVRTQLNTLFSNAETTLPQLNFKTSNAQAGTDAVNLRVSASIELNAWKQELATLTPSSPQDELAAALKNDLVYLDSMRNLLNTVSTALDGNIDLGATALAADKANVTTGLTEVNAAMSGLNTISQNIASQEATVAQAQAQLQLKQAGSTPQDIAAQEAQVQQVQAALASAEAKLQNAKIVAPIDGVITQQDAKIGQIATAGTPLVSIIGNKGFEVDAGISEVDVGKVAVGDTVAMTLDAFPNETFAGTVFYIAPAQTNTQGVITYLAKISFDTADPRIKSGLTANVVIRTATKDNVLILPQYALLQNDQGSFVEVLKNNVVTQVPVTIGIQDEKGNVEMLSGVTEGEQVLNIGLKS
ncbi:MAG: efflux RND transporter periplasmic adaptor subunit [Patescibacteria group bacterium]|nr:efflux RND transporter periplasmic adaptor subunit [Patescibacteria group bacterium]